MTAEVKSIGDEKRIFADLAAMCVLAVSVPADTGMSVQSVKETEEQFTGEESESGGAMNTGMESEETAQDLCRG